MIKRKGHETLYGDKLLIVAVIIRCFHQFKGFSFNEKSLKSKGISEVIEIPFVSEIRDFENLMGKEMIKELNNIFQEF